MIPIKYAVRLEPGARQDAVRRLLTLVDREAVFDPEGNPATFWVTTILSADQIRAVPGVEFVVKACGK